MIKTNFSHHVSMDLYHEFEKNIIQNSDWEVVNGIGSLQARVLRQVFKFIPPFLVPYRTEKNYIVIGFQKEKFFPYFHFKSNLKVLWMYDAWEPMFPEITTAVKQYQINVLLTASKQSADYFNTLNLPNFKAYWVPEAIDVNQYKFVEYADRTTDVLQLGRKWNEYHDKIKTIEDDGSVYLYEKKAGEIIFKTRESFLAGMANSKISICVPSDITHPDRTGNISTMTNRYLQSMASKCLILGKLPYDMQLLFDYNPIIEIDMENPVGQLHSILNNFEQYIPLIEKNYKTVKEKHSWNNRISEIENCIQDFTK